MRIWEKEHIEVHDKKIMTYVVRCSIPNCQEMGVGGGHVGRWQAHDALPKLFALKGWTISNRSDRDVCPACTRKRAQRAPASGEVATMPKEVGFLGAGTRGNPAPVTHIHAPQPPDTMSKQDRRVIFAKLEEVYVSEEVGYGDGWDDQKVATDLGVPVAWIAEVREPNFGPNKSQQAVKVLEEGQKLLQEVQDAYSHAQMYYTQLKDAMAMLGKLGLRVEKFDKDLKDLAKRSSK